MFSIVREIILNYLLVQLCVLLFVLPFYLLYRWRHPMPKGIKAPLSRHIELFFGSKYANWLVFAWAFGEAVAWFVIPEFLLLLMVFMRVNRKRELLVYDVSGTVFGALTAYVVHWPISTVERLPYVTPGMVAQVQHWYARFGVLGLAFQPFSGVPFKVFTNLAASYHFWVVAFVALAVVFRISRYFVAYTVLVIIYPYLHRYVYLRYVRLFFIATFIFSLLLLRVYSLYGPTYHVK